MTLLDFLNEWTIDLNKLPKYDEFRKPFTVKFDKKLSNLLVSQINPKITTVMASCFKNNVYERIGNDNLLTVKHNNRYGLGRFYSDNDASPCCHTKFIKHTVFQYQNWLDIDMVKGHPSILLSLLGQNGMTSQCFDNVVHNFDTKWKEIALYYKKACDVDLDEDNVKTFFNMILYGGGYTTWIKSLADENDALKYGYPVKVIPADTMIHPFMSEYKTACLEIMELVYDNNPSIVSAVCDNTKTEYEKKCSCMAYFCGVIENHIVYFVYKLLVKLGGILPNQCLPEMDGICLPRLKDVDYDGLINQVNSVLSPIGVKFKIKPYNKFVLHDVIEKRIEMDAFTDDDETTNDDVTIDGIPTEIQDKLYISLETLDKGENDIGRHISKTLIKTLVFCNGKWFLFDKKTCLWRLIRTPSAVVITTIQTYIDETKMSLLQIKLATDDEEEKKKLTNCEKKYNEFYKQVGKGAFTNQIIKILQDYLFDGGFEKKLDTTPYFVAYQNGMYDLKTGNFRSGLKPTDYLTQTIPYDFETAVETDVSTVKLELLKICNNNYEHLEYYLSSLGYSMTGDSSREQKFWSIRGQKASNGKSVIFDALMNIIPNYIVKMESDIFEVNYGSRHKEISTWKGVRIGYINELSKKRQDENVLKELADGTCMRFKVMYGGMDTMPITLKCWIVGNSTIKVNADNGIKRRLTMLQFDSEFDHFDEDNFATCQFKKDLNFGMLLQTKYKHALMSLIYQYSKKYVDNNFKLCSYPDEWVQERDDVIRDNNKFEEYFYNHFEIDNDGIVSRRVMDSIISGYKNEAITIKDELKKMKIAYTYDSKKKAKGERTNGCFMGFKEILYEDNLSVADNESFELTELL